MNESDSTTFFTEVEEDTIAETEEIPNKPEGLCSECFGSGYKIRQRGGVLGVLFTANSSDSEGKPIRRLLHCDCKVNVAY